MSESNLKLYADIASVGVSTELTSALGIPELSKRQLDLQYITAVFVSSGYNLNSAYFLPSELILAKDTVAEKPLDLEHEQDKIVGHLFSSAFTYKDGSLFNPEETANSLGSDIDNVNMDIVTAMRLYKARFPELADDVDKGKYKVSMECFYRGFDVIVDNLIIPLDEARAIGLVDVINNIVSVVEGTKAVGKHRVGRVLRGMLFSGCGLVESPANPDSIILETAAYNNNKYVLDLTRVDSYMKAKQEKEAIVIHSLEGVDKDKAYLSASYGGSHMHELQLDQTDTFLDGSHTHMVSPDSVPEATHVYFINDGLHRHSFSSANGKIGPEKEHVHKVYTSSPEGGYVAVESGPSVSAHTHEFLEVDVKEKYDHVKDAEVIEKVRNMGGTSFGGVHFHNVVLPDGTKLKTLVPSDILNTVVASSNGNVEVSGEGNVDGKPLSKPEVCVSFKRYIYDTVVADSGVPANADKTPGLVPQVDSIPLPIMPGAGDTVTQLDTIKQENWCSLFDVDCPTPGGLATHPDCLRLVLARTTKDLVTNYLEKLEKNRESKDVKKALSSLKLTLGKVKKEP